ncbi:putative membrane protein [Achromobacter phage Mano]|uniref:Putative membrane protein n=1 Tax=Achromobacter phage Mano TaxID=2767570 RepID=A0A7L8G6C0_9CAUD|nr:hypothetical protein KB680_gp57 [Achromobacter phage Mano]QOE32766.1 putative membrane protein [Achromobacter phage Mano]
MKSFLVSAWSAVDAITKAGAQLVKAAIALALAAFFLAIAYQAIF